VVCLVLCLLQSKTKQNKANYHEPTKYLDLEWNVPTQKGKKRLSVSSSLCFRGMGQDGWMGETLWVLIWRFYQIVAGQDVVMDLFIVDRASL
jgi:hypothetical protein